MWSIPCCQIVLDMQRVKDINTFWAKALALRGYFVVQYIQPALISNGISTTGVIR